MQIVSCDAQMRIFGAQTCRTEIGMYKFGIADGDASMHAPVMDSAGASQRIYPQKGRDNVSGNPAMLNDAASNADRQR